MEFFVVLIISEIDPSLIEQLVAFFLNMCHNSCQNEIKSQTSFLKFNCQSLDYTD